MAKRPELFSEEVHNRILARIRARTVEDWKRIVEEQPQLPEDWPSLIKLPAGTPPRPNGSRRRKSKA